MPNHGKDTVIKNEQTINTQHMVSPMNEQLNTFLQPQVFQYPQNNLCFPFGNYNYQQSHPNIYLPIPNVFDNNIPMMFPSMTNLSPSSAQQSQQMPYPSSALDQLTSPTNLQHQASTSSTSQGQTHSTLMPSYPMTLPTVSLSNSMLSQSQAPLNTSHLNLTSTSAVPNMATLPNLTTSQLQSQLSSQPQLLMSSQLRLQSQPQTQLRPQVQVNSQSQMETQIQSSQN